MAMKVTAVIPARSGSIGLKDKNLQKINGRSLIQRAVDLALDLNCEVIVTTNIAKPLSAGYEGKVKIHKRRPELCSSNSLMIDVIKDVIRAKNLIGTIVLLQPTSPLRTVKQLKEILDLYHRKDTTLSLSVSNADNTILKNFVKINDTFTPINNKDFLFQNRQDLPQVYHPNGAFYVFDASTFILKGFNTESISVYEMDDTTSIDIDTIDDLELARLHAEN